MHSSIRCAVFSVSHSFIKNGPFVEITLDNRQWVECDDERRITNEMKIWNDGKQRHAPFISYFARNGRRCTPFHISYSIQWNFLKCCQYNVRSQLAYYFVCTLFSHLFYFLCSSEISPEGQQTRTRSTPFLLPSVRLSADEYVCMHVKREWKLMRCNNPVIVNN